MADAKGQTFRDKLLVLRAQTGDRQAFDELLCSFQKALYSYICSLVGDPTLAEDVLQDVFLAICRNLRYLREPRVFRPWAYRIASRQALRVARRERKRSGLPLEESGADPVAPEADDPRHHESLVETLPLLLAEVSPASRAVLSLHYLEEMSLQETADVLGIPVGTAKSRLGYGLASIRRLMKESQTTTGIR